MHGNIIGKQVSQQY